MEKNRIVPLIYGYVVCLVAIIVTLVSISMLIGAIFKLQDPIRAIDYRYTGTANLSSFESYKIDVLTGRSTATPELKTATTSNYQPSDAELRTAYDAAKADRIASVKLDANQAITNSVLMLIVAGFLFITHWRWVTRQGK